MDQKVGAPAPLFGGGRWVHIYNNVVWAEVYLRTKWHLDPTSRLTTTDMGGGSWVAEHPNALQWAALSPKNCPFP